MLLRSTTQMDKAHIEISKMFLEEYVGWYPWHLPLMDVAEAMKIYASHIKACIRDVK